MERNTLLLWGQEKLTPFTRAAYLEASCLLCFVLKISLVQLIAHSRIPVQEEEQTKFQKLIQRRCKKEPIPYLTGECEFWSLPLTVSPDCLIPRHETELLVQNILERYTFDQKIRVADLGTGSGAIAIALSLERPHWEIVATDQSDKALKIAKENAKRLNAGLTFKQGNWFEPLKDQACFDVIISNPPYLAHQDPHLKNLSYEPRAALVGGEKGIEIIHFLIQNALCYLLPKGALWVEQGFDQAQEVKCYFQKYGYKNIRQYYDLERVNRFTSGMI